MRISTSLSRHCHVTPRSAVIGCNNFASWIFSNMSQSLQLQRILHAKIACNYSTWNHCLINANTDIWKFRIIAVYFLFFLIRNLTLRLSTQGWQKLYSMLFLSFLHHWILATGIRVPAFSISKVGLFINEYEYNIGVCCKQNLTNISYAINVRRAPTYEHIRLFWVYYFLCFHFNIFANI